MGLILFSDPSDYSAPGVPVYPHGWNLPGGGAQRGNVLNLNGAGDPLTPGYPAKGVCLCEYERSERVCVCVSMSVCFWVDWVCVCVYERSERVCVCVCV